MSKYYDNLNDEVKKYFSILSPIFPNWLLEYIDNPEMERINKISMSCGTDYSKCFNVKYWYSNLDHSVAVALIIWNFTHDKKQTLAGLFHDIATPAFKHCIDFMNGDSETQESTEEFTTSMITNSPKIMNLLQRDNIKLEDVGDYKIYPIADNELPKLSADRFEYTFSSGLTFFRVWNLEKVKKMYNNIVIAKNEEGLDEFAFKDKDIAEEYIDTISKLWPEWIKDENRTVMQFLADICMSMKNAHYLNLNDLYTLSEKEIIDKILNCDDTYLSESFKKFLDADKVYKSDYPVENKYSVNVKSKTRYIIPLVQTEDGPKRITEISKKANKQINEFLNAPKGGYYTYFDFDFIPYYDEIKTKKYIKKPNLL